MKVAIVGSRDFPRLYRVREYVEALPEDTLVISGGARGVDREAVRAAKARGLATMEYFALWKEHGRSAGPIRNARLVQEADCLMVFWDGVSKGTLDTIHKAEAAGKPCSIEVALHP